MPTCDTLTHEKRFMGLFIGRSGSGKTVAEASFPGPQKLYDFDGRINGILGAPWITQEMRKLIDYSYYPPVTGMNQTPNYVKLNQELDFLLNQKGQFPYKTITMDSLTSFSVALLRDSIPISRAGRKVGQMDLPGPGDYGFESKGISDVLAYFRSLPVQNVIVSAHTVERYGKLDPSNPYSESVPIGKNSPFGTRLVKTHLSTSIMFLSSREKQSGTKYVISASSDPILLKLLSQKHQIGLISLVRTFTMMF